MSTTTKLPLTVRKAVRDTSAQTADLVVAASAIVGCQVTFNYDLELESVYAALATNRYQSNVVQGSLDYLSHTITAMKSSYLNPVVKQDVNAAWTTKNFSIGVVSDQELEEMRDRPTTAGTRYCCLRIHNGDLQMVSSTSNWGLNVYEIDRLDLTPLAGAAANRGKSGVDALPLEVKKHLQEAQQKLTQQLTRIHKLKGLEDAQFDLNGQTVAAFPLLKDAAGWQQFSPLTFPEYLDQLATILERMWTDDMNSEALLDVWTAPHVIEVRAEVDLDTETGTVVKNLSYHGIKIEDGKLVILAGVGKWRMNVTQMSQVNYMDLVSVL